MDARRARSLLVLLVLVSACAKSALAWLQATPVYLPDEYLYGALSRSLLESGRPLVQGGPAHFWALLVPVLEAPAWLAGSVGTAYRLVQAEQSLAVSLSALPVYWLACRLGVARGGALAAAAVTLLVPDTVFSSVLLSESFALPLFLGSVCTAVAALDRGGPRRWAAFAALALLATAARLQFVFLLVLAPAVGVVLEARRRRVAAAAAYAASLGALVLVGASAVALEGISVLAGRYGSLFAHHVGVGGLLVWAGYNSLALAFACGWVVVPAAAVGLARMTWRPAQRVDDAFALVTLLSLVTLLLEAALFAQDGLQAMERYTFYSAPLLVVAFAVGWQRRLLEGRPHAALALGLTGLGLLLPRFAQFLFTRADAAPSLLAYRALLHVSGLNGGVWWGIAAGLLGGGALVLGRRGEGRALAGLAMTVGALLLAGAQFEFHDAAARTARLAGGPLSFADEAGARDAAYLTFSDTAAADAEETAFWNRSVTQVFRLGSRSSGDGFRAPHVEAGPTGRVLFEGRPIRNELVVDRTAAYARFDRPPRAQTARAALLPPAAALRELVDGSVRSGSWLATAGSFRAWPARPGGRVRGSLDLRLWGTNPVLELRGPDCSGRVAVTPRPVDVQIRFDAAGPWSCRFVVPGFGTIVGTHVVGVHARILCFEQAPRACPPHPGPKPGGDAFRLELAAAVD